MTKQTHTPHGSGESLREDKVALIIESLPDLIDRSRVEIKDQLKHIEGLVDVIARHVAPQSQIKKNAKL